MQSGVEFTTKGESDVHIRDVVAGRQYGLLTADPIDVRQSLPERFPMPVTDAIETETTGLWTLDPYGLTIRGADGDIVDACLLKDDTHTFDGGEHVLDRKSVV